MDRDDVALAMLFVGSVLAVAGLFLGLAGGFWPLFYAGIVLEWSGLIVGVGGDIVRDYHRGRA